MLGPLFADSPVTERHALAPIGGTLLDESAALAGVGSPLTESRAGILNHRTIAVKIAIPTNIQFAFHDSLLVNWHDSIIFRRVWQQKSARLTYSNHSISKKRNNITQSGLTPLIVEREKWVGTASL
jgi:hypothetical protein